MAEVVEQLGSSVQAATSISGKEDEPQVALDGKQIGE